MLIFPRKNGTKLVYTSSLHLFQLLTLGTPMPLNLPTPLSLAKLCLHPSQFTSPEMLLNISKVDETDGSLHAFE